jgi:hypothetical protein
MREVEDYLSLLRKADVGDKFGKCTIKDEDVEKVNKYITKIKIGSVWNIVFGMIFIGSIIGVNLMAKTILPLPARCILWFFVIVGIIGIVNQINDVLSLSIESFTNIEYATISAKNIEKSEEVVIRDGRRRTAEFTDYMVYFNLDNDERIICNVGNKKSYKTYKVGDRVLLGVCGRSFLEIIPL